MSEHKPMPREERAKQFMAFSALKGYSDALQREEEEVRRAYEKDTADGEENLPLFWWGCEPCKRKIKRKEPGD